MTSCSRLWRSHSLFLQLLAPHNTKLFPSAKLFSASTLTTRCFFRKENGIRMDHIHLSFFKINMSVKNKTLHPAFSIPWLMISMLCPLQRVATLHRECFFIHQPWQRLMGLSSWRSGRSARSPGRVSQFLWCFWYIYIYPISWILMATVMELQLLLSNGSSLSKLLFKSKKSLKTENTRILFFPAARAQVFVLRLSFS